jgi:hypothetical protein
MHKYINALMHKYITGESMSENKKIKLMCVRIEEELYNQLRELAFRKTKRLHGAITIVVIEALKEYIEKHSKELAQIPQA